MTDRELLDLAAKAAGYDIWWKEGRCKGGEFEGAFIGDAPWNPLADDGDAFRLAVELNMSISIHDQHCMACAQTGEIQTVKDMPTAEATRRAIVRAAADIGKSM